MVRRQQAADRARRPVMYSPGRPVPATQVERQFWRLIAKGMKSGAAAVVVGVSGPVGSRWFRHGGGMPPISLSEPSGRYLALAEREDLAVLRAQQLGVREIARRLGRAPSTVSRELRRNAATRGGQVEYRASVAQWKAETAARRPKQAKLVGNPALREYVQRRLSGQLRRPDGTVAAGPRVAAWTGRNKPRREDRRWATAWSPEQIAHRLPVEFLDERACGSATRRSTRPSTFRAAGRSSVNSSRACVLAGRCGCRRPAPGTRRRATSPPTSC